MQAIDLGYVAVRLDMPTDTWVSDDYEYEVPSFRDQIAVTVTGRI